MWALTSIHCLPHWGHQEPLDLSDSDDIDKGIDTELL